jgi:hypothetical protein
MKLNRIGLLLVLGAAVGAMACGGAATEGTSETQAENTTTEAPAADTGSTTGATPSAPSEAPTDQYASNESRPAPAPAAPKPASPRRTDSQGAGRGSWDAPMESTSQQPTRAGTVMRNLPAGQELQVVLLDDLSSAISKPGDSFRASVSQSVMAEGGVAIPSGAVLRGTVVEAVPLNPKIGGRAKLVLDFDRLELPSGETVPVNATLEQVGKSETAKDAATIAGATAGGAILGRVLKDDDRKKGTLIGAVVGAATGTAIAAKTQGQEVQMVSGTAVTLKLTDSVSVPSRL